MQQLTKNMVAETGGFVGAPVRQEIKWTGADGQKYEAFVYVRLDSYAKAVAEMQATSNGADYFVAKLVASICDSKGKQLFQIEDLVGDENGEGQMCSPLFIELISAINRANKFVSEDEEKN